MRRLALLSFVVATAGALSAQTPGSLDWTALDAETLRHFQALVQIDSTDPPTTPPGVEKPVVDYLRAVLEKEGIATETFALEPNRPNLVARLKGSGKKRPLLLMAHTDTVNIDVKKWTNPPFSALRQDGYIYGRGTVDDKDNVTATLMALLTLKRQNVALERDVIALFEAGEEGAVRYGIAHMAEAERFPKIDAEFCLAEGGSFNRQAGKVTFASIQTLEKIPRAITLTARGTAGHGSVPLRTNAVVKLTTAVSAVAKWKPPISFNETTAAYFKRLASISDKYCVVRTMTHQYNDHSSGAHYIQTGHPWHVPIGGGFNATEKDWPAHGSIVDYVDSRDSGGAAKAMLSPAQEAVTSVSGTARPATSSEFSA